MINALNSFHIFPPLIRENESPSIVLYLLIVTSTNPA